MKKEKSFKEEETPVIASPVKKIKIYQEEDSYQKIQTDTTSVTAMGTRDTREVPQSLNLNNSNLNQPILDLNLEEEEKIDDDFFE